MTTAMLSEIREQPQVLAETVDQLLTTAPVGLPVGVRRIVLAARGTSAHAAAYAAYLYGARFGLDARLAQPSMVTGYRPSIDLSDAALVAVSQSGATQEILEAVDWAREQGAQTFGVSNVAGSPLLRRTAGGFVTPAGVERAVPATKSHTAQALALGILGAAIAGVEVGDEVRRLPDLAAQLVSEREAAHRVARLIDRASGGVLVVGRGYTASAALEIGLKLEETCLQPVRALSYADLRHGPFAVLDRSRVVLVVAPTDGPLLPGFTRLVDDISATGARVVLVGGDEPLAARADEVLASAIGSSECWTSPLLSIAGQLVAHELGALRGLDVDSPRHLTKVGVTDVPVLV